MLPALKSGFMVLADRYNLHPDGARPGPGFRLNWLRNLYDIAVIPDAVFYLQVSAEQLVQRTFAKSHSLDYWESGMDLGLSRDMFDSFIRYQRLVSGSSSTSRRSTASPSWTATGRWPRSTWSCGARSNRC